MPCSNRDLYGIARGTALEVAETAAGAGTARTGLADFEPESVSASATITPAIASPAKTNQVIRREPSGARGGWDMGVDMRPPDGGGRGAPAAGGIWNWDHPAPRCLQLAFRPLTTLAATATTALP